MQGLTDPPRDHLTADQVRALLTGEDVQRDHGAELLDENNQVIEDLGADCRDWTVTYASGTGEEIHGSLDIELTRQLDWGRVRVRPYVDLTASELATVTRTVIDRPARSVAQVSNDAGDWAAGAGVNIDGSSGALRLAGTPGQEVAYPDEVLLDAPVGYWRLGESSGSTAVDASGNGRNGSYIAAPTLGAAGIAGAADTAVELNGAGQYITVPALTSATPDDAITAEGWINLDSVPAINVAPCIVSDGFGGGDTTVRFALGFDYFTGQFMASVYDGTAGWTSALDPSPTPTGEWVHYAGTYDGATIRLYRNGAEVGTKAYTGGLPGSTQQWFLGKRWTTNETLDGRLDEVAVYDQPLSPERIAQHYQAGLGNFRTGVGDFATSGSWTSPALDLATLEAVSSSLLDWQATTPAGTSLTAETSVNGGATWQPVSDGSAITGANPGGTVQARLTLTSDGTVTPEVVSLTLTASQTEQSHGEVVQTLVPFTGRFYAGVYVLTVPDTHHGRDPLVYDAAGKNLMYLLDRQVGNTYRLGDPADGPAPTYLDALRQVVADAGLSIPVLLDGDRQDTVPPKPRVWAIGDTRFIDVVNDLMAEIAYTDLFNNELGTYRAQPIVPLEQRPPEWTFDTEDQATDLIDGDFVESQDLHGAYNTWTFVRADLPYQPVEGDGLFTVPPPEGTPVSEVRPAPLQEIQAADQAALEAEGLRIVAADQRLEHQFRINVDPLPLAGHRDCVTFRHDGRVAKMQVTTWRLTPYGKGAWTLGGGTGGAAPERPERQVKATVTQSSAAGLRVVVDGATVDSPAAALADDSGVVPTYDIGTRVRVTVRSPEIPLVQGKET